MPSAAHPSPSNHPQPIGTSASEGVTSPNESSKFKRFLKRFGRRPSEEGKEADSHQIDNNENAAHENSDLNGGSTKKASSMRSRKGSKTNGGFSQNGKNKKGESMLSGRFFQTSQNAPPLPNSGGGGRNAQVLTAGLENTNVGGLANTLTVPANGTTSAPLLDGVPSHEPLMTSDLMTPAVVAASTMPISIPSTNGSQHNDVVNGSKNQAIIHANDHDLAVSRDTGVAEAAIPSTISDIRDGQGDVLSPQSSYGSGHSRTVPSFDDDDDDDDESGNIIRRRDSVDNRTMDTSKSRASTKPTTLMSMDTRENVQGGSYTPMAQIAQHRHGDMQSSHQHRVVSSRSGESGNNTLSSIQFASAPPMGRTQSGTIVQLPGQGEPPEEMAYAHVPTVSRPHPANNPNPSGIPADNASVLTLASSTAAASIGGGAASSRGHQSHAAQSFGGARSIGGSLMGDRRNSSDTYASVKALPPLSRRGSDASARTGMSIAASATGRSSAQAMMGTSIGAPSGPGAPGDRISIHRTPSQKTIATQLSIPLSHSNVALAQGGNQNDTASITSHLEPSSVHNIHSQQASQTQPSTQGVGQQSDSDIDVNGQSHSGDLPSITTTLTTISNEEK